MTHGLIVDLIQLRLWELSDRLGKSHQYTKAGVRNFRASLTWESSHAPHSARCGCQTAKSKPRLCATRNSSSRTSVGSVLGIWAAYESNEIGLFVVLVARNNAVNLFRQEDLSEPRK